MKSGRGPKTVYVLGAGFSKKAEIPLQSDILRCIVETTVMDARSEFAEKMLEWQGISVGFVERIFERVPNPILEDVFTLIDQSIARKHYCGGQTWKKLLDVRDALSKVIVALFHLKEACSPEAAMDYYRGIAGHLIEQRVASGQENDPFAIISLNWDSVLENGMSWFIKECGHLPADVDYCCYTNPLSKDSRHKSSLSQKALGIYNLKVLKLHGSINWILCPNCNRLYTGLGEAPEVMAQYVIGKGCPACNELELSEKERGLEGPLLEPFIITPTFVKEFDNAHIQMVWHNAYIELREADKVVFVGYSLPEADYHLRTLLKRAIQAHAKIEIVLTENDKVPTDCRDNIRGKFAESRYKAFFGEGSNVEFIFGGAEAYFEAIIGGQTIEERKVSLEKLIAHNSGGNTG